MNFIILLAFIIGFLLIGFNIFTQYLKLKCNTKITGEFVKTNKYISYGNGISSTNYSPVFKYTFNDITFENQTFQTFSKKYIEKNFLNGKFYTIYINKKHPKNFIIEKRFQPSDWLILLLAIFFLIIGFLGLLA